MHIYKTTQYFSVDKRVLWDFISNPKNLATITPPEMDFKTLSGDELPMYQGQVIHYTVRPLLGIKVEWLTEITHVDEGRYFVDEQRFGPYSFWHHKHFLQEIDGGVAMEDIVHYKLPLGFVGKWIEPFVRVKLEKIFEFRRKVLEDKFGKMKAV